MPAQMVHMVALEIPEHRIMLNGELQLIQFANAIGGLKPGHIQEGNMEGNRSGKLPQHIATKADGQFIIVCIIRLLKPSLYLKVEFFRVLWESLLGVLLWMLHKLVDNTADGIPSFEDNDFLAGDAFHLRGHILQEK